MEAPKVDNEFIIKSMTVDELKIQLKIRGLNASGKPSCDSIDTAISLKHFINSIASLYILVVLVFFVVLVIASLLTSFYIPRFNP